MTCKFFANRISQRRVDGGVLFVLDYVSMTDDTRGQIVVTLSDLTQRYAEELRERLAERIGCKAQDIAGAL